MRRRTRSGASLGKEERLDPETALVRFLPESYADSTAPPRLRPGDVADLCLLDRPWRAAREELAEIRVVQTWIDGNPLLP